MRWVIILMIVSVVWQVLGQIIQKQQQQKQIQSRRPGGAGSASGPTLARSGPPRTVEEAIARRRAQLEQARLQAQGGSAAPPTRPPVAPPAKRTAPSRPAPAPSRAPAPPRPAAQPRSAAVMVPIPVVTPDAPATLADIEASLPPLPQFAETALHDTDRHFAGSVHERNVVGTGRPPRTPHPILARFHSRATVRELILAREILDPPAALR